MLICLSLFVGAPGPTGDEWYVLYEDGKALLEKGEYEKAAAKFRLALEDRDEDRENARTYGVNFIEYFPHRELGACLYHLSRWEEAKRELEASLQQTPSSRAREYLTRVDQALAVRSTVAAQPPPAPSSGKTSKKTGTPAGTAVLAASAAFFNESGDGILRGSEEGTINVHLVNSGKGVARSLHVRALPEEGVEGIRIPREGFLERLGAGESRDVELSVVADADIGSGSARLRIEISDDKTYALDPPVAVAIPTAAFKPPELAVSDVSINDQSGNGQIEQREIVEVTARIKNVGEGVSRQSHVTVQPGDNIFLTSESRKEFALGNLPPGASKDITFAVYSNAKASDLTLDFLLKDGRPDSEKKESVSFDFDTPVKKSGLLAGGKKGGENAGGAAAAGGMFLSDLTVPKTSTKNPDAVAVVIGISRFKNPDVPPVDYAKLDAAAMKEYLISAMGYDERRIITAIDEDGSLADFKRIFEAQLPNYVRRGKSDVFVFYSGHGAPDPESKEAFFVPYDCNPTYAKQTGFRVKELYERLAALRARSVTVAIDACFSGSSQRGMLMKGVSPIFITVENPVVAMENGIVFTSATGQQVSTWYPEKKHSLFTYFFLKGLSGAADQNGDGKVTVAEMDQYLAAQVPDQARYLSNREQTPQVAGRDRQRVLVKY
jgi:hypothetical protein